MSLEKKISHSSLAKLKSLIEEGKYRFTYSSRKTIAEDFNITPDEALEVIHRLTGKDLYKSMQSHSNTALWQDVYHKEIGSMSAYIKLQISLEDDAIIISFKKLSHTE